MLRDAARLAFNHVSVAYVVQKGGLPVIDVAHHGDDRRPRHALADVLLFLGDQFLLDVLLLGSLCRVPHFLDHEDRRVLVQALVEKPCSEGRPVPDGRIRGPALRRRAAAPLATCSSLRP